MGRLTKYLRDRWMQRILALVIITETIVLTIAFVPMSQDFTTAQPYRAVFCVAIGILFLAFIATPAIRREARDIREWEQRQQKLQPWRSPGDD